MARLEDRYKLYPFIHGALTHVANMDTSMQNHTFNTALTAFFLGERLTLRRREAAMLKKDLEKHGLDDEYPHLIARVKPNQYKFTERGCVYLWLIGLLHDIGKVYCQDVVRLTRRLTPEEYTTMKTHVPLGVKDISKIRASGNLRSLLMTAVEDHHERVDGKGYTEKKEQDISLFGRIMAMADTFDALRTSRAYDDYRRQSDEAMEEIKRCGGTQFDKYLANQFYEVMKQPLSVYHLTGHGRRDASEEEMAERITRPAYLFEQTKHKYPSVRFLAASLRALMEQQEETRYQSHHTALTNHLLGTHLELTDAHAKNVRQNLRTLGLTDEAKYVLQRKSRDQNKLQTFGTVSLFIAGLLRGMGIIGETEKATFIPGRFTREQKQRMQQYVQKGARILERVDGAAGLKALFRQMHLTQQERWDGRGYPHGIRGEDIPVLGRMLALGNHLGSVTSYKPGRRMLQTHDRIIDGLGESFRTDQHGNLIPGQHDPHLAKQAANLLRDPYFFKKVAGDEFYRATGELTGEQVAQHLSRVYTEQGRTEVLPPTLRKPRQP